ncbi:hypothetical protein SBA1_900019 [Candidatus Sulfotelmatobacter kueseliae]|uniref:Biopterin-dependent aromatic amino acid hydroxylase family profile domain-containing protein n=1 Tax=Candidatus Sulfotelmatobacter kueseliae TaxID=2042962 RepID=A0A2U3LBY7_9BACT|nr:hypothetical protein SBA1_900019 [Candidatus Sulfotelmatobacter kueseliae]
MLRAYAAGRFSSEGENSQSAGMGALRGERRRSTP